MYCRKVLSTITTLAGCILTLVMGVQPIAAQDVPVARITLPIRGQTLRGNVTIQGSATSPQFTRFIVSYAAEPDLASWTVINGGLQPQPNGMLAVWNTHPVPDGKYALRLQVVGADGSVIETLVREITLSNTAAEPAAVTSTGTLNTDASGTAVSTTPGAATAPKDTSLNLSDIPRSFLTGARYTLYAFGALAAYLLLKKILGALLYRLFHRPVDYGR